MDSLRLPVVAARVVAWHNRHPLARRITAAHVHSIGYVVLPYAVPALPIEPTFSAVPNPAPPLGARTGPGESATAVEEPGDASGRPRSAPDGEVAGERPVPAAQGAASAAELQPEPESGSGSGPDFGPRSPFDASDIDLDSYSGSKSEAGSGSGSGLGSASASAASASASGTGTGHEFDFGSGHQPQPREPDLEPPPAPRSDGRSLRERAMAGALGTASSAEADSVRGDTRGDTSADTSAGTSASARAAGDVVPATARFGSMDRQALFGAAIAGPRRDWLAAFEEDFIAPLSPAKVARWVLRQGVALVRPPDDGPLRVVSTNAAPRGTAPVGLYVLTAAVEIGGQRHRVLLGAGPQARILGHRAWSRPRSAAAAGLAVVCVAAGAAVPLLGSAGVPAAAVADGSPVAALQPGHGVLLEPATAAASASAAQAAASAAAVASSSASAAASSSSMGSSISASASASASVSGPASGASSPRSSLQTLLSTTLPSPAALRTGSPTDPRPGAPLPSEAHARAESGRGPGSEAAQAPAGVSPAPTAAPASSVAPGAAPPPPGAASVPPGVPSVPPGSTPTALATPASAPSAAGRSLRVSIVPVISEADKAAARAARPPRPSASAPAPASGATADTDATASSSSLPGSTLPGSARTSPAGATAVSTPNQPIVAPGSAVFAISTRPLRTRTEADQVRDAMRALLQTAADGPVVVDVLPHGDDWRVVGWPLKNRRDADRARALLVSRGMRVEVVDF